MKNRDLTGREVHHLVESARESGDLLSSLELAMRTLLVYAKEDDQLGFAEALDSIFLAIKYLHQQQKFKPYWILAGAIVRSSVEIARQSGINTALALPQFNLAKYLEESGELGKAKAMYQEAIHSMKQFPPKEHDRPAVITQMKLRLALCELTLDDVATLDKVKKLLAELALDTGVDADYNCKVWISGGYLRLVQFFKDTDLDLARKYFQQAKEVIESDERLLVRRQQLDEVSHSFLA